MKKQTIIFSSVLVLSIVVSFFLGMLYSKNNNKKNISPSAFQGNMAMGYGFNRNNLRINNMVNGTILSKDDTSLTIKLKDGGSKIIIFSNSTNVLKSLEANINDINVGDEVAISGKTNSDGSIMADSIQIRDQLTPKQNNNPAQQ